MGGRQWVVRALWQIEAPHMPFWEYARTKASPIPRYANPRWDCKMNGVPMVRGEVYDEWYGVWRRVWIRGKFQ